MCVDYGNYTLLIRDSKDITHLSSLEKMLHVDVGGLAARPYQLEPVVVVQRRVQPAPHSMSRYNYLQN